MKRAVAGLGLLIVLFMFLLVLMPLPVHAASTLVQQNNNEGAFATNPFTISVSFSSNVVSGDVVAVGLDYAAGSLLSVSDSLVSSYSQAVLATNGQTGSSSAAAIWTATLASSGADTVSAKFSLSCAPNCSVAVAIYIFEVSGVTTAGAGTGTGTDTGTSFSTSSVAFQTGAFLLGMISTGCDTSFETCTYSNGSGFTLVSAGGGISAAEYATSGVSSPTTFPATLSTNSENTVLWAEAGLALNPSTVTTTTTTAPPIPEYPLGLPILAILTIIGYGLVRRRTRNDKT